MGAGCRTEADLDKRRVGIGEKYVREGVRAGNIEVGPGCRGKRGQEMEEEGCFLTSCH